MSDLSRESKRLELDELRQRVAQLESDLESAESKGPDRRSTEYYWIYYATTGFFLGMIGAVTSLLFNVVGASAAGLHPLKLVKVYLTFGLGERALTGDVDSGLVIAIGCCLYIATGMLLGVPFHMFLTRFASKATLGGRLALATALGLGIWVVNYYLLLSWLQPLLFGGSWIVTEIPVWVAASTHLVFGWTMAVIYPWGLYEPYKVRT